MDASFSWSIPIALLALVGVVFAVILTAARLYKKVSPNVAAVITGRKHEHTVMVEGTPTKVTRGFRIVTGGGYLLIPIVEKKEELSLNVMSLEISATGPDKNGAIVTVEAIANVKILSDAMMLPLAVERFLGMDQRAIEGLVQKTLEGNLRAIISTMAIEDLIKSREEFAQASFAEAGGDLAKLGVGIDNLKIQNLTDPNHYISSLGKKQTAEIVKNAAVGEAEAKRETDVKTAEANRAGRVAQADAAKAISDAERDRDTQIADNDAKVKAQQARVPLVAQQAAAVEQAKLNTATVDAEKATITAGIAKQEEEKKRRAAELDATTIIVAEKDRQALVIAAEAKAQAAEKEGEATRVKMEKEGQGQQAKDTGEAAGRKAKAAALQAEKEAEAAGEQANLLAKAKGREADLLAGAAGTRAQLLAEAEGVLKKAEAFKALDEGGRFLMILQALPPIIDAVGVAAEKALTPAAEAIGQGLGNVKEMRIIDMGGSGAGANGGKNVISQFVNLPVETIFGLVQKIKASGMMPMVEAMAKKYGFDLDKLMASLPANVPVVAHAAAPGAESPAAEASASTKD